MVKKGWNGCIKESLGHRTLHIQENEKHVRDEVSWSNVCDVLLIFRALTNARLQRTLFGIWQWGGELHEHTV